MGRPVIAPAHGGAIEVVEHEHTGLLFTPNDAQALATAIHRYRHDTKLRETTADSGRRRVVQTFSVTESARAVEALYARLLSSQ